MVLTMATYLPRLCCQGCSKGQFTVWHRLGGLSSRLCCTPAPLQSLEKNFQGGGGIFLSLPGVLLPQVCSEVQVPTAGVKKRKSMGAKNKLRPQLPALTDPTEESPRTGSKVIRAPCSLGEACPPRSDGGMVLQCFTCSDQPASDIGTPPLL